MSLQKSLVLTSCVALAVLGVFQTQSYGDVIAQWMLNESPITVGTTPAVCSNTAYNMTYHTTAAPVAGYWGQPHGAVDFGSGNNPSGYAITGTLSNAPVWSQTVATVEAFFKLDYVNTGEVDIYDEGNPGGSGLVFGGTGTNGGLQANWCWSTGWGSGAVLTTDPLVAGRWYYAAATYNSTTGQTAVYLYDSVNNPNGLYSAVSTTNPSGSKGTLNHAYIGCATAAGLVTFAGSIGDVTVYNTALDQATMLAHATQNPLPEPSTLVLLAAGLVGLLCYAWRKRR